MHTDCVGVVGVLGGQRPLGTFGRTDTLRTAVNLGLCGKRSARYCANVTRCPTAAMTVNEPGLGSSADRKGEKGIDRGLERTCTLMHLGK